MRKYLEGETGGNGFPSAEKEKVEQFNGFPNLLLLWYRTQSRLWSHDLQFLGKCAIAMLCSYVFLPPFQGKRVLNHRREGETFEVTAAENTLGLERGRCWNIPERRREKGDIKESFCFTANMPEIASPGKKEACMHVC